MPAAGGPDRDAGPRPDLADDPGERRSRRRRPCRRSRPASGRASRRRTRHRGPARRRVAAGRPSARRGAAMAAGRDLHLVEAGVAQALGDRRTDARPNRRPRRAAGRPARARRRHRPARRSAAGPRRAGRRRRSHLPSRSRSRSATTRAARREGPTDPGSLSGTSRRSTTSPPSPPVTSMAKCRPRAPEPDRVAEPELGDGRGPGRQVDEGETAGHQVELGSSRRSRGRPAEPALRPACRPAGVTTVPERREDVVDQVGDHRPPLVRHPGSSRAGRGSGRGRGRTGRRPAGGARRPGRARRPVPARRPRRRRSRRSGRPVAGRPIPGSIPLSRPRAARAAAIRSVTPSPVASAHGASRSSRRRSRRRCRSAPQVDHRPDPVDDRIVGIEVGQRRASATTARSRLGGAAGDPGRGRRARPGIEADLDDVDPPIEDLGQRDRARAERATRVVGWQRQLDEQVGERPAGRAAFRGRTEQDLAGARRDVAERAEVLAHPAGEHDRQVAAAGRRPRRRGRPARRARAVRRPPADRWRRPGRTTRRPRGGASSSPAGRSISALAGDGPPAAPRGRRDERRERALRGGHDGQSCAAGGSRPRAAAGRSRRRSRRSSAAASDRIGGHGAVAEDRDDGLDVGAGGHRQRPDEAPAPPDPPDQGGSRRGGARIEGEEGSGFARHPLMLPGPAAGRCRAVGDAVRRPRRPRRPSPRDGR